MLIAVHLSAAIPLAYTLNIWVDEAYSLQTSSSLSRALESEVGHPPGYFLLLTVWRQANGSLFFARLLSTLCTVLTIFAASKAARRWFSPFDDRWLLSVLPLHPVVLWAASEARPYALVILLSATLIWLLHAAFLSGRDERWYRFAYAVVGYLALSTQYYLGFLLVANVVPLVALRRWRAARDYLLWMLPVALASIPLVLRVGDHIALQAKATSPLSFLEAVKAVLLLGEGFVSSLVLLPNEGVPLSNVTPFSSVRMVRYAYRLTIGLLLIAASHQILLRRRRFEPFAAALGIIPLVMAACFVGILTVLGGPLAEARHAVSLLMPALMLFFALIAPSPSRTIAAMATALLLASNTCAAYVAFAPLAKRGDHARVAAHMTAAESPGQSIFVFPSESLPPFAHHYRGANKIIPLPGPAKEWNPSSFALPGEDRLAEIVLEALDAERECWMFTENVNLYDGVPMHLEVLDRVVEKHFVTLENRVFFSGARVRRLRRRDSPLAFGAVLR